MDKFMKLFKKRAEKFSAKFANSLQASDPWIKSQVEKLAKDIDFSRELFGKTEEEAFKEFVREYLLSKVVPVAMPADKDDEELITIEEPNLLGIKFAFALVKEIDDGRKIKVSSLAKTINELGIEHAELIRHAEQNINPMIKIEKFQDMPEMALYIWLCKYLKEMGEIPDDVDLEMPVCAIRTSFGIAGGALMSTKLPEMLKEQLNTDSFYVLPASRFELIAVPAYFAKDLEDVKRLTDTVKHVNRDIVIPTDKNDFLSNNTFFYDGIKYSTIINFPTA